MERADLNDKPLNILLNEHDFYRKEIIEASLNTLDEGQLLLERVKNLGACTEIVNQHSTVASCYEVEHLLGVHQDERHQFEDEWERNRKLLSEYAQMSTVRQEIDQVNEGKLRTLSNNDDFYHQFRSLLGCKHVPNPIFNVQILVDPWTKQNT